MSEQIREKVPAPVGCGLHDDLDHLAGNWTDEEAAEFDAALAEQRKIEPEL